MIKEFEKYLESKQDLLFDLLSMTQVLLDNEPGDYVTLGKGLVRKLIDQTVAFAAMAQGDFDRVKSYLERL